MTKQKFSFLERLVLLYSHPRRIFFNSVGMMWAVYFLWINDWPSALFFAVAFGTAGLMTVWNLDPEALEQTTLGRLALLHLHPANLVIQLVGLVPLVYGIWTHSVPFILGGLSIVMIGHSFGWEQVNAKYRGVQT